MSRTTLGAVTAAGLAALSLGVMAVRYHVLGEEIKLPAGPNVWKVTLTVQGRTDGEVRLLTASPLDFNRQHVVRETYHSTQLTGRAPDATSPLRRRILWTRKAGVPEGLFKMRGEFICSVDQARPTAPMSRLGQTLYAPPARGAYLDVLSKAGTDNDRLAALARQLSAGKERHSEQAHALFQYVDGQIVNEPQVGPRMLSPAECLTEGSGDSAAKACLLLALLRNRGIPGRLVSGVILSGSSEQQSAHHWVEAWLHDRWVPMCPFYHHYGPVPATYLVFTFENPALIRGRHVRDLDFAFLVERYRSGAATDESGARRFFRSVSLYMLPPAEQRLVQFLLLL